MNEQMNGQSLIFVPLTDEADDYVSCGSTRHLTTPGVQNNVVRLLTTWLLEVGMKQQRTGFFQFF